MSIDLKGAEILEIAFEVLTIPALSESDKDTAIPEGEVWYLSQFGGSGAVEGIEFEITFSDDSGVTWKNPYDATSDVIRCLHLGPWIPYCVNFDVPMRLVGAAAGANILRLAIKNLGEADTDGESFCYVHGWKEGANGV